MSDIGPETLSAARPAVSRKAAWVIVSIMTFLLVLALVGVVWGFVRQYRLYLAARGRSQPVQGLATGAAPAVMRLAPGVHIVSAGTDAGKLVLHVTGPDGAAVEIIDLQTGRLTAMVQEAPR